MGRELPRHEIESRQGTDALYHQKEPEIFRKSQGTIRNSTPGGKIRTPHATQLPQFEAQFKGTVADLKKLTYFGLGGARAAAIWKPRTERARGDLPGFWNDVKLELATRATRALELATRAGTTANAEAARRSKTVLDLLEQTEQKGGLGTRLEEWNTMVSSGSYSWDLLDETAGQIKQGIEFCKEMVNEGFGDLRGLEDAQTHRHDLSSALDAIASEIIREADEIITPGERKPGRARLFDAVVERFEHVSPRAGSAARLHDAIEKGNLHQAWAKELPEAIRSQIPMDSVGLSQALETWKGKADGVRDVMKGEHTANDELDAAKALDAATEAIVKSIDRLTKSFMSRARASSDEISMALDVYNVTTFEILRQHETLESVLRSKAARNALNGQYSKALRAMLNKLEQAEPSDSVHSFGRNSEGKLNNLWQLNQEALDGFLRGAGKTSLADKFAKEVGPDLNNLLDAWAKRTRDTTYTDATYTLAWKLIANLRDAKSRSETLLSDEPTQRDHIGRVLDTIADFIAVDVAAANTVIVG